MKIKKLLFGNIVFCGIGYGALFLTMNLLVNDFISAFILSWIPYTLLTWKIEVIEWDD